MKKKELQKHLEWTFDIIITAQQYLFDSRTILLLDTDEEDHIISPNKFMTRAYEAFWYLSVIDAHKLFGGKNDDYRIQKLINYLRDTHRNSEWKDRISLKEINSLESKLKEPEVVTKTELLNELRNQHYAHKQKSPNRYSTQIELYFEGVDFLLTVAENVCDEVNKKVFDNRAFKYVVDKDSIRSNMDNLVERVRLKAQENMRTKA